MGPRQLRIGANLGTRSLGAAVLSIAFFGSLPVEAASRSKQHQSAPTQKAAGQTKETRANAANDRGVAHAKHGRYQKALAAFGEAIRLMPAEPRFYINRALVWYQTNQTKKALEDCTSAIRLSPEASPLYLFRGAFLIASGHLREAITDFTRGI